MGQLGHPSRRRQFCAHPVQRCHFLQRKVQWYTGDPQINGVFIPEGGDKPTPLDTAGHTFRFPKTRGTTFGPIWVSRASDREKASKEIMRRLGPHRVLLLHANAGITFDLVELKAAAAGRRPTRFQAVVVNQPHEAFDPTLGADVWLLVDGQLRLHLAKLRNPDGPVDVSVSLQPADRFLTLVSTDSGDGSYFDNIEYHDPCLVLETDH